MAYMFSSKIGRKGRKIINHPIKTTDMNFVDFYDEISQDWQNRARALRERRMTALKYQ